MTTLHLAQHIYASVEADQSPQGRGGFQTLFYTRSALTEAEVQEIEARALYFPGDAQPVKRVFFTTSTGKPVILQIVPLTETDSAGRSGLYIAHSYVLSPTEFTAIGCNPFPVLRSVDFITSVAEALALGDRITGDIPEVEMALAEEADIQGEEQAWALSEWKRLTLLALRAEPFAAERKAIALVGTPEQVEHAVEAALVAVPSVLRVLCSFDTFFYRCNLVSSYYWAVGLPQAPITSNYVVVDALSRNVSGALPLQPETCYERWFDVVVEREGGEHVHRHRDVAFAVCELIDSRPSSDYDLASAPEAIILSAVEINTEQARKALLAQMQEQLPRTLTNRIFERTFDALSATEIVDRLRRGFDINELLDTLYDAYVAESLISPSGAEMRELRSVLSEHDHPVLATVLVCWEGKPNPIRKAVAALRDEEYTRFITSVVDLELAKLWPLLLPGHEAQFLDACLDPRLPRQPDWAAVVKTILTSGDPACLARMTLPARQWPPAEVQAVAKLIRGRKDMPEGFRTVIKEATDALARNANKRGWFGRGR